MSVQKFSLVFALLVLLIAGSAMAGAVGGPQNKRDTVMGLEVDVYKVVFEGKSLASVRVSGDGSTDLDCDVFDSNGNLIDSDTSATDECLLQWRPAWTGKFTIKVHNLGRSPNEYRIWTN